MRYSITDKEVKSGNNSDELEIYWTCLAQKCPRNCCGKYFENGEALNVFNMNHDQVLLLPHEKNSIIKTRGPEFVKREKDGMFYLNMPDNDACPFLKTGRCAIQEIKPALCKAYPLIRLDCHVGPVFDSNNCPGFDIGRKSGIRMNKKDYIIMLESFISVQQYRLDRIKIELRNLAGGEDKSMIDDHFEKLCRNAYVRF
jgi:Fe-S-cluster containining protein